jgi:hypothetical protein
MNFQDTPTRLGMNANRNARKFADNGKFIASAGYGKKRALRRPLGNRRIRSEPRYCEALGEKREFKFTVRGGH